MSDIIPIHGEAHRQTQALLPWFANGTLDPEERALVEGHLSSCSDCAADLRADRLLAGRIAVLAGDADRGWETLQGRIAAAPAAAPGQARPQRWLSQRIDLRWALAAQLAAAALFFGLLLPDRPAPQPTVYRALGSAPAAREGNLILLFRPDSREGDIRRALADAGARIVDGPTESGAFVVRAAEPAAALPKLRASPLIVLAEPIGDGRGA